MHTPHPTDDLASFALGALPSDEAAQVEAHIAVCAQCRRVVDELANTMSALASAVPIAEPPGEAEERILRRVRELRREEHAQVCPSTRPTTARAYLGSSAVGSNSQCRGPLRVLRLTARLCAWLHATTAARPFPLTRSLFRRDAQPDRLARRLSRRLSIGGSHDAVHGPERTLTR